jgi:hypothetical protein
MASSYELRGWIQPCDPEATEQSARAELSDLGVDVGQWDDKIKEFKGCIVTGEALTNLDPFWGRYIWGLQP